MNKNIQDFLSILKGFIHETKPEITEQPDWDSIFKMAGINGVSGIVGYMILKYQLSHSDRIIELAKDRCANSAGMSIRKYEQANRLLKLLNENEIRHTVMKGYCVRDCYPDPRLRAFGDVDLLIHEEDRKKTDKIMGEHGYRCDKAWEPVYTYKKNTEFYEIHTRIIDADITDRYDYIDYFSHAWNHTRLRDNYTYEFTYEYHLLYLIAHLAKHIYSGGAGIRMYMDIALFAGRKKDQIDWTLFNSQVSEIHLTQYLNYVYQAIDNWLGVRLADYEPVSEEIMEEMLNNTVFGGTFGFNNSNAGIRSLRILSKNTNKISRARTITSMAFPSAETMKSRYTYLESKPWLLPVAWIHRIILNRNKIGHEGKKAEQIIRANGEEIEKSNALTKSIGL